MKMRAGYVFLLTLVCFVDVFALRIYFIGNSLTDEVKYGSFQNGVVAMGDQLTWGRHMVPGTPLLYLWREGEHSGFREPCGFRCALTEHSWDAITLQAYDWKLEQEVEGAANFSNLAKGTSPDVQMYIYAYWPLRSDNYEAAWLETYDGGWKARHKDYFERLTLESRALLTDMKPMLMIPVGHVMYELDKEIRAGRISGISSINEVYSDNTHLNDKGSYIVACTFYATIFKKDPHGFPYHEFSGVTAAWADAVQAQVWPVVTSMPDLSGVGTTAVAAPSASPSLQHHQVRSARSAAFGLSGRVQGAGSAGSTGLYLLGEGRIPVIGSQRNDP